MTAYDETLALLGDEKAALKEYQRVKESETKRYDKLLEDAAEEAGKAAYFSRTGSRLQAAAPSAEGAGTPLEPVYDIWDRIRQLAGSEDATKSLAARKMIKSEIFGLAKEFRKTGEGSMSEGELGIMIKQAESGIADPKSLAEMDLCDRDWETL